tara:strand:- start:1411 stop:1722 length:312 start_codon:yes stop_codon:yes gene_type:complete
MKTKNTILLDGDDWRHIYPTGFTKGERWNHNIRIAQIAKLLEEQGFDVIISFICPYKKLRDAVQEITNCSIIYLLGGEKGKDYPYEIEEDKFYLKKDEGIKKI